GGIVAGLVLLVSIGYAQGGNATGATHSFTIGDLIDQLQGFVWPLGLALFAGLAVSFYQFGLLVLEGNNAKPMIAFRFARGNPEEVDKIVRASASKGEMGRLLAILYAMGIRGDLNFHAEVDLITRVREERFASFSSWMVFLSDSAGAFGLLGTVWGMYQVFYFTGGVLDTQTTLAGMGTALVTTLVGIGISVLLNLFATTMESIFRGQVEQMYNKADDLRFHFVNRAQQKRQSAKAEESAK
ncbi:MAG TPA: MotA/TolQ/ExbB proton channel family protein, partial [Bacteroidetes bacterium]|nr:MotA/TolQ/ExbB proton channel family protein [Bacteroidota bacterium]HEX04327.1 MotA/TolQ/ExbB proton channel family protein [Bacteroidota bacterium]